MFYCYINLLKLNMARYFFKKKLNVSMHSNAFYMNLNTHDPSGIDT